MLGIVRVIFTRRQFDLLLLQRKGNLLDVNELQDEAEDIFYGDQVPLDKIISKVQQMEECEDTCDVTKRLMQGVYPATNSNKYDRQETR